MSRSGCGGRGGLCAGAPGPHLTWTLSFPPPGQAAPAPPRATGGARSGGIVVGVVEDRKGSRTERPRNPLPCPALAQPELRCPWEMKMTADTLEASSAPRALSFLFPPPAPNPARARGPEGLWARAPNPGNPASNPETFSAETPEGLWTAKHLGGGEGDVPARSQGRGLPEGRLNSPPPRGSCCVSFEIPN
uniref:Uncharacterized protein n=1 Tax=Rangifer tarandus platyrhynchus TaxID=3082113 RepID=A0ACB0FD57_RANTA|nr:unnamed protein product [Rangifer tarandus platyrhynchus]